jgi:hypothetical protein
MGPVPAEHWRCNLGEEAAARVLILAPVLDDWECLSRLLPLLDKELRQASLEADVLAVDDGSQTEPPAGFPGLKLQAIRTVLVLRLARNVGHQRAIAIALPFAEANLPHRAVVVMDSDGEDRPADVVSLIAEMEKQGDRAVVFASRSKRSEGLAFRLFYQVYRLTFWLLVGQDVRVGNFSALPRPLLARVVSVSEIWNHYSAGVRRSRIPYRTLPCDRGARLAGRSRMNLVGLVVHGLSAISVFGDVVGTRALLVFGSLTLLYGILALVAVVIRLTTTWAIPGWATYAVGLSAVLLLQSLTLSWFFVFLVLNSRNNQIFLPARDYKYFVSECRRLYPSALPPSGREPAREAPAATPAGRGTG